MLKNSLNSSSIICTSRFYYLGNVFCAIISDESGEFEMISVKKY